VEATVHSRAVVDGVSHVFEVFKDKYRSRKLRHPFDYSTRDLVQTVVNVVAFFSLDDCLKRGLPDCLHPLALGKKLVASFFHRWILEHDRVFHRPVLTHRSECDAVFVHINANDGVSISLAGNPVSLVRDGDVKPPLIVLMDDFSCSNSPLIVGKRGSEAVKLVWASTKFTVDVRASRGSETESNRSVVFREQSVPFPVVHHHRVRLVNVWVWTTPPIIFVVMVRFEFTECFVNDELAGVFDVGGVVNDG